jgi:mono/diheme cytochrome c family protein
MKALVGVTTAALVIAVAMTATAVRAQQPDPAKAAAGQKVFETQKCSTCHAVKDGEKKPASSLVGVSAKLSDADMKKWLTDTAAMEAKLPKKPAMSMATFMKTHKLSDADVDALVAYMKSLK